MDHLTWVKFAPIPRKPLGVMDPVSLNMHIMKLDDLVNRAQLWEIQRGRVIAAPDSAGRRAVLEQANVIYNDAVPVVWAVHSYSGTLPTHPMIRK